MKNFSTAAALIAAAAILYGCGKGASVSGVLDGAVNSEVVLNKLDGEKMVPLDTVKTDASGAFKAKLEIAKGQPEFVYLFYKDKRVASLLLENGDKAVVKADTIGNYSVEGSAQTDKLMEAQRMESEFNDKFYAAQAQLSDLDPASEEARAVNLKLSQDYVKYYRECVKFVLNNSKSLAVIPVLYSTLPNGAPVFSQVTDAMQFKAEYDSLITVYPESKYVKALGEEAKRRTNILGVQSKLSVATVQGFPDIDMNDVQGKEVKLSEVKSKVVMVYFWASTVSAQKMFNLDVIKPVYRDYHDRGLEIYAVSLDTDKAAWATAVKNQNLGWINVCDGLGQASPSVSAYNVGSIPTAFFIVDGTLQGNAGVSDAASLRRYLDSKL